MKLSIGILACGKGRRTKQNPGFFRWKQQKFLQILTEEFSSYEQLLLSVDSARQYKKSIYPLLEDEYKDIGPLEGVRQLLLHSRTPYMFICATDMPFLKHELADYLSEFISKEYDCYVVCDGKRTQPLCAIYSTDIIPDIEEQIGRNDYRLINLLSRVRTKYIYLKHTLFSDKMVRNMNIKDQCESLPESIVFCLGRSGESKKTGLIFRLINEFKCCFPHMIMINYYRFKDLCGREITR